MCVCVCVCVQIDRQKHTKLNVPNLYEVVHKTSYNHITSIKGPGPDAIKLFTSVIY